MSNAQVQSSRLGFARPAAATDTLVYTAMNLPTEVTRIMVTNQSNASRTFRVYHVPFGGSPGADNGLYWDQTVAANSTFVDQEANDNAAIALSVGDMIWVRGSGAADVLFTLYGMTASVAPGIAR